VAVLEYFHDNQLRKNTDTAILDHYVSITSCKMHFQILQDRIIASVHQWISNPNPTSFDTVHMSTNKKVYHITQALGSILKDRRAL